MFFIGILFSGCIKDVTNTIALTLDKRSANNFDLSEYGYKNGKYRHLDVGHLRLKTAHSFHKIIADDVKVFHYSVPKNCRFIGYITIENPKGLKDMAGNYGIGRFDTESNMIKRLKKSCFTSRS
ncbi:hypothetical protein NitYY0918_C0033 [Nitratiruptor sp. YY09-18]|nr:hypothetical protein NitYY0918_C0033 [Nitratiruptor sp. YY09-18]